LFQSSGGRQVLLKIISIFALAGKPFAAPIAVDLKTHTNWIYFLAHYFFSSFFSTLAAGFLACRISPSTTTRMWLVLCWNLLARPRAAARKRLKRGPGVTEISVIVNVFGFIVVVMFGVSLGGTDVF
jgi:hypothetical protein